MRSVYSILIFVFFSSISFAEHTRYEFKGITKSDGLSDLLVNVIYQDSDGFIWLGTGKGIDRFDGIRIEHFSFESNSKEHRIRINTICETPQSQIWTGNAYGLWKLDKTMGQLTQVFNEQINFSVNTLFYNTKNNLLYIGSNEGLYVSDTETIKKIHITDNIFSPQNEIRDITSDNKGTIWIITAGGLMFYDSTTGELTKVENSNKYNTELNFRNITYLKETIYIGTFNQGIICYDINTGLFYDFINLGSSITSSISTDGEDIIYASTDGNGVFFISHSKKEILKSFRHNPNDPKTIRSNSIYSLHVDKEERMWVGFYQDGFDYTIYQSELFKTYNFSSHFDSKNLTVRSFIINGRQKLIGTRDGLYFIDEDKKSVKKYDRTFLQSDLILALTSYNNEYYIGTYDAGLYILNPETSEMHRLNIESKILNDEHVFSFRKDMHNNLWIGTSKGIIKYNSIDNRFVQYTSINSPLPEGNVYEIFFDSSNKGWVCCEKGMALIDPTNDNIRTNVFPENFFHKEKIRMIYEDSQNQLYFLPEKGNLFVSDINLKKYNEIDLPTSNYINVFMSIIEDDDNCLWLTSDGGLIRICNDRYRIFNNMDGIPSPIFTNNSIYKDESGILWFGNSKGLLYTDIFHTKETENKDSKIILSGILINGEAVSPLKLEKIVGNKLIELKPKQNNFTLNFANLSYSDANHKFYEYKLDNIDEKWELIYLHNDLSFYNLTKGKHRLYIRLPGDNKSLITFKIKVKNRSLYFDILNIAIILILVISLIYIRNLKIKYNKQIRLSKRVGVNITDKEEKYKTLRLDENQCDTLLKELNDYIVKEKAYINPTLRINDLAEALDTSTYNLSYLFNQYLETSYYDFINEYRINEFKLRVQKEDSSKYTLETLANLCGFSSRTSFFRSFKKNTGITPNEYLKNLEK